ncbi:MAG: hypothetical protein VB108_00390 [Anaerolineaceae bacterium]|nr:hypothetical protein [Anaerolineaceae bacterium]
MQVSPEQADVDYWVRTLLPPKDVYFLDDSFEPLQAKGAEVLAVDALLSHPQYGSLVYNNAYEYWNINKAKVRRALAAEPDWFGGLPMPERARLFRAQATLGRGMVFGKEVLHGHAFAKMIEHAGVEGKLVLNHFLWNRLDLNMQQQTVERVAKYWEDFDCEPCPLDASVWIRERANRFIHQEGCNCFAASLFGASGQAAWLEKWVWKEEFLRALGELGFEAGNDETPQAGDISVFYDEYGREVHTCFHLSEEKVLNKSGQTKYNALKVLCYQQVLEDWKTCSPRLFCRAAEAA